MVKMKWRAAIVAAVAMRISGALAATTTLTSTNDYYYTLPKSTNIVGKVMGENGDYSLVRYEDAAWIAEAWAERIALGGSYEVGTNAPGPGLLVKGGGIWPTATREYWTNAVMVTTVITNKHINDLTSESTMARILGAASGGAMTNATRRLDVRVTGKLVAKNAITNAYKVLRGMDVVVRPIKPGDTNTAERIEESRYRTVENGQASEWSKEETTGKVSVISWALKCEGTKTVEKTYWWDGSQVEWLSTYETEKTEKMVDGGEGEVRLEFGVRRTEDWMRGKEVPKVVKSARAWGVVHMSETESEHEVRVNLVDGEEEEEVVGGSWQTNATVLVDLGEAQWKEARAGEVERLVYAVEIKPAQMLARSAGATPWMRDREWVEGALAVPEVQGDAGNHSLSRDMSGSLEEVYLVIQLQPVTSLPGW